MRNTNALKPCPFCGGKANIKYVLLMPLYWQGKVYCRDCRAELSRFSFSPTRLDNKLIKIWNRRGGVKE